MASNVKRSPLFYVGDKYKLVAEIKEHFEFPVKKFVEPFVGGGSVFLNIPAEEYYLNDIDSNVIDIHKLLCEQKKKGTAFVQKIYDTAVKYNLSRSVVEDVVPESLKHQFVKTYYARFNKDGYLKMRDDYNKSEERDVFMLYMLLIYGFNHMIRFNVEGNFNLPVGNVDFNPNVKKALIDYFETVSVNKIHWSSMDFEKYIKRLQLGPEDLVYLDPPYLITFSEYNKLWNEETEKRLLSLLDHLQQEGIRFALSNVIKYKGRVNNALLEWINARPYLSIHPIKSNYISYHDNTIKSFNDVLITNF